MEFKKCSGKADGRAWLEKFFNRAWSNKTSISPEVALIDALQGLIGFTRGTGRDCALRTSRLALSSMDDGVKHVILCFDRQDVVPIAKGAEQALRTKNAELANETQAVVISNTEQKTSYRDLPSPGMWLDKYVPDDFTLGLQDRAGFRRDVIRFLVKEWLGSEDSSVRLQPHNSSVVIISGHCLRLDDLVEYDLSTLGLESGDDPEDFPIEITPDIFQFRRDLKHRVGEGEMQFFSLLRQINPKNALMISTDTDVCFLGLIYLRKYFGITAHDSNLRLHWRYDARCPQKKYCNLPYLFQDIQEGNFTAVALMELSHSKHGERGTDEASLRERWKKNKDPVMQVVAAQALAGTDYTQGFLSLTHESVFETMLFTMPWIGDMVIDIEHRLLNPQAYIRLVIASWIYSKQDKFPLVPPTHAVSNNAASDIASNQAWQAHAIRAWEITAHRTLKMRFPHPVQNSGHFLSRALRWCYYMIMQLMVGENSLDLPNDLTRWGFGPLTETITHANVFPLLTC